MYRSRLTSDAEDYFSAANLCAMSKLKERLVRPTISRAFTCTDLQKTVMNIHLYCLRNHSAVNATEDTKVTFCSILSANLDVIVDTFTNMNPAYLDLILFLKELTRSCGGKISDSIKYKIPALLISIVEQQTNVQLTPTRVALLLTKKYRRKFVDWS
jgi:hypothetical protein